MEIRVTGAPVSTVSFSELHEDEVPYDVAELTLAVSEAMSGVLGDTFTTVSEAKGTIGQNAVAEIIQKVMMGASKLGHNFGTTFSDEDNDWAARCIVEIGRCFLEVLDYIEKQEVGDGARN